jgi:hypothetical protein
MEFRGSNFEPSVCVRPVPARVGEVFLGKGLLATGFFIIDLNRRLHLCPFPISLSLQAARFKSLWITSRPLLIFVTRSYMLPIYLG